MSPHRFGAAAVAALLVLVAACGASPAPPGVATSMPATGATSAPAVAATFSPPSSPPPTPAAARLTVDATGLGPCQVQFPLGCAYVIRLEGSGGYDHFGTFVWAYDAKRPGPSSGINGDLPTSLPPGAWTFSFGLVETSDVSSFVAVPSGTPRTMDLQPGDVGCREAVTVTDQILVGLHVVFKGPTCAVTTEMAIP